MTPKLLDLCSKAGGASYGYALAGFHVTGIDKDPQPRYAGHEFIQADIRGAITDPGFLAGFDALAGSPPCQAHTAAQRLRGNTHPDLIPAVREAFQAAGKPYVIENVPGAPLLNPVELCGCMFPGLGVYRPRLFEAPWLVMAPPHGPHREPVAKMGRPPRPGERMHVVGNFSGVGAAREAMGIDWMTRDELREAIPPAYTRWIGEALLTHLAAERAA